MVALINHAMLIGPGVERNLWVITAVAKSTSNWVDTDDVLPDILEHAHTVALDVRLLEVDHRVVVAVETPSRKVRGKLSWVASSWQSWRCCS